MVTLVVFNNFWENSKNVDISKKLEKINAINGNVRNCELHYVQFLLVTCEGGGVPVALRDT